MLIRSMFRKVNIKYTAYEYKVGTAFPGTEVDKTNSLFFTQMSRRQKTNLQGFIISQTGALREEAAEAGVNDYFVQNVTEQQPRDAIQ
ncbi:MAG: hypothetical protein IJA67_12670 [Oscillospiraceae bacterium]|nr:hypothetical protein [Oscillospiraceae bacterium]